MDKKFVAAVFHVILDASFAFDDIKESFRLDNYYEEDELFISSQLCYLIAVFQFS